MRFGLVRGRPATECVRDEVTGLVWEGKTPSGYFGGSEGFTQLGNGEIEDVYTYVQVVNAIARCGYYDWRLPTRAELMTIVNYGSQVRLEPIWFPNQPYWGGAYRASDVNLVDLGYRWVVDADGFSRSNMSLAFNRTPVRLVRGQLSVGTRFSFSSVSYPGDAANNLVTDGTTGLQWRRCVEGQTWTGSGCSGTPAWFDHPSGLAHAHSLSGWRVPNVKELNSLIDLAQQGSVRINTSVFPSTPANQHWSSTPHTDPSYAISVDFAWGDVGTVSRSAPMTVRLVRLAP